ncbi:cytochrome oxidase assembly protein ShyY1 [Kribbella steppae]|uniref:SURF1-like protein n=1 Tax=Kribbella steppae TaxID=2512223 RepID=A0A4R2HBE7_9ACTN|nr:SURF1 family protein [Kribbella steppae]TCO24712.1 cytochrome oxidase assembly protein ShyY1 [Kribbella steppae]
MPERSFWRTALTPRWVGLLVLALAIAAVMSVMGVWQLEVYQSKTAAATAKRAEGAPVALQSLFSIDEGLPAKAVGRRVTVSGEWGPAKDQLFISDRRQGSEDGFWVVTPLLLTDTSSPGTPTAGAPHPGAVMVVRGWVSSVSDPAARPPSGPVELSGAVAASEAQDSSGDAANGRVLQSLRIPTIVHMVDYRIYDAFVVQSSIDSGTAPQPAPAVVPAPAPPTDHAGLRNVAYAFQWWIFAAFTLWMWTRMVQDARRPESPDDSEPSNPDPTPDPDPDSARVPASTSTADPASAERADQAEEPVQSSGTVSA